MKRAFNVFLVFITLFFLMGAVSAACTNENQTIMRLYSGTNTHGALWTQTGYSVTICYDTIFGAEYSPTDSAPHACTAGDKIISLTGATNAHASSSVDGTVPYTTIICYKGLKDCNAACNGKKPIVYLSNITNAHLSNISLPGYFAICCNVTSGSITPPPQPQFCSEYDATDCSSDPYGVANATNSGCTPSDGDTTKCHCILDADNICKVVWNDVEGECSYRCVKTVKSEGACDDVAGMKEVNITAQIVPLTAAQCPTQTEACQNGTVQAPCGFITADLPFFGAGQFALSLVAVLFVYLTLIKKR